jgi:hypothetical protein
LLPLLPHFPSFLSFLLLLPSTRYTAGEGISTNFLESLKVLPPLPPPFRDIH